MSACVSLIFRAKNLYALGGYNSSSILDNIEKLCLKEGKWENVKLSAKMPTLKGVNGIQISKSKVLIFGGGRHSISMLISMDKLIIKEISSYGIEENFESCPAPVFDGENVYAVGSTNNLRHFNLQTKKWRTIL